MKNIKVLVTGCAGFIPSFVTERLLESGAIVTGIDNFFNSSHENMKKCMVYKNFTFIEDDIRNNRLMNSLIKRVDMIYHAAVRGLGVSTKNPVEEAEVNINATISMLELAQKHGIKKFIYTSSASVYGNAVHIPEKETDATLPISPYGVSKLAAERYCIAYFHMYKLPVVCLRYFNTYGPRQKKDSIYGGVVSIFINNAIHGKPLLIYGTGKQTRDFTYIEDIVDGTLQSFIKKNAVGKIINISRGQEFTVNHLAHLIKKISGKNNLEVKYVQERIIDNIQRRLGDITQAKRILQYNPKVSLEEGLQKTYEWYKIK